MTRPYVPLVLALALLPVLAQEEEPTSRLGDTFFALKAEIPFGQPVDGELLGTETHHAWEFDGLEGARVELSGPEGFRLGIAGPKDLLGYFGYHPLVASENGRLELELPEDGLYIVLIGGKAGEYRLELKTDQVLPERSRQARQMVFFAPKTGEERWGWSEESRSREIEVLGPDRDTEERVPANVAAPVVDLFRRAEKEILVCMYGMSLNCPESEALLEAARRGVNVRVYLDVAARDSSTGIPYSADTILGLLEVEGVEVRVPSRISTVMHEKFGVVDDLHAFCGSANMNWRARDRYTEDRFVFWHRPEVAKELRIEFERLWKDLGQPATDVMDLLKPEESR